MSEAILENSQEIATEAIESANAFYGQQMKQKWSPLLEAFDGISDEHTAIQTAIMVESYINHLQQYKNVLLNEDEIKTGNLQGVNLALVTLIRRAMPEIVGLQLVGMQAMPTPESPLFFLIWQKALSAVKGKSESGQDLMGYPGTGLSGSSLPIEEIDPYFSSSLVRDTVVNKVTAYDSTPAYTIPEAFAPVLSSSAHIYAVDAQGNVIDGIHFPGAYTGGVVNGVVISQVRKATIFTSGTYNSLTRAFALVLAPADQAAAEGLGYAELRVNHEYVQEANPFKSEIVGKIEKKQVQLISRDLRGKYTYEAMVDAKTWHGIDIESELMATMKATLTNEINREIVTDLVKLAAIRHTIKYSDFTANNTVGNYDDTAKLILDTIAVIASEVYNQTRVGRANWVLGNPVTLAFLDRIPGFLGSGVEMDSKGLAFKGRVGRLAFYEDPQFAKNRLLIGYKGSSALDTGYIYAPYTPITAMPGAIDPDTHDIRRTFKTRYAKTFSFNKATGLYENVIYRGEWFYAVITLEDFPYQDIVV